MTSLTPLMLGAAALAALTVLLLTQPWWRPYFSRAARRSTETDFSETAERQRLNASIYRDQLVELERDHAIGQIDDQDFETARAEINRRLLDDVAGDVSTAPNPTKDAPTRRRAPTWLALVLLVPLSAASIYLQLGTPAASLDPDAQARKSMGDMDQAVNALAAKLKAQPDNPDGWAMLARSYGSLGRWEEAAVAFSQIGPSLDTNPDLLATFAEVKFRQSGNQFTPEVRELVTRALALAPDNMHALLLAGSDAFQSNRWQEAINSWEKLAAQLEPGSDDAREINDGIAKARAELGVKVSPGKTAQAVKAAPSAGKEALSGRVELAPELRKLAKPDDTVFVFARAVSTDDVPAPRMPLAAKRLRVADLPYDFRLDDSMAMSPAMRISGFSMVRVEARVSASGNAIPASGDLTGESTPVKPGTGKLTVRISKQLP